MKCYEIIFRPSIRWAFSGVTWADRPLACQVTAQSAGQRSGCQFAADLAASHTKWRRTWRFLI
jgi:hypothetical protein